MAQKVSDSDPRPHYVQIADDLRTQIDAGELSPGDRLPSGRELATTYGVAPMTIQHALRILREEGRIQTWQGRGAFVADGTPAVDTGDDIATQVRDLSAAVQDINRRLARLEKEPRKTS